MHIASAGILDAVGLTICDPTLPNLSQEEWIKFLTDHSLYFCQKFLEDNADIYNAYASRIGFWQGAMFITYELGGNEAARECAYQAYNSITDNAINDAKNYFTEKFKGIKQTLNKEARKTMDDELSERSEMFYKAIKALEDIKKVHDNSSKWSNKTTEAVNRYNTAVDDFKTKFKEKGLL